MPHAYTHLLHTVPPPPPPPRHFFLPFDCYIPFFGPLSFTNGAFDFVPNAVWAHKMVVVEEPPLILSLGLTLGTPKKAGVMQPFRPLLGPREGRVEVANSDFVPSLGTPEHARVMQPFRPLLDPREGKGEVANSDFVPPLRTPDRTGVTGVLQASLTFRCY